MTTPGEIELIAEKIGAFAPWFHRHRMLIESIHWLYESMELVAINPEARDIDQRCEVPLHLLVEVFESAGIITTEKRRVLNMTMVYENDAIRPACQLRRFSRGHVAGTPRGVCEGAAFPDARSIMGIYRGDGGHGGIYRRHHLSILAGLSPILAQRNARGNNRHCRVSRHGLTARHFIAHDGRCREMGRSFRRRHHDH